MTKTSDPLARGSADRFGYQWSTYSDILPAYETQFRRWLPFMQPEDWRGMTFLDVGCGTGRNSYWPLTYGASAATLIDVDDASLAVARENLAPFPNVEVRYQSAYDIDDEAQFDITFSIGVIHHLADPEQALAAMVRAVKPGGRVMIWVYGLENNEWIVRYFDPFRRALFSRLPVKWVHGLSMVPATLLWLLLRLGFGRIEYLKLMRTFSFSHLRLVVFDQMLPEIANYWSKEEVRRLMESAGLREVKLRWVNEMSWAATGMRPPSDAGREDDQP